MKNTNLSNVAQFDPGEITGKIVGLRFESVRLPGRNDVQCDDKLQAALSTLAYLLSARASVAILSHVDAIGRESKLQQHHDFGRYLSELIDRPIRILEDCRGPDVADAVARLRGGELLMLGNLALEPGEAVNDLEFSRFLSGLCDLYCNEAFGLAHEARASTVGTAMLARRSATGLGFDGTLRSLSRILDAPARPLMAIFGGALSSSRLLLISEVAAHADVVLVGGALCVPFLAAEGRSIGAARVTDNEVDIAARIWSHMRESRRMLLLPEDYMLADAWEIERLRMEAKALSKAGIRRRKIAVRAGVRIEGSEMPADIGVRTQLIWSEHFAAAHTVFWHGPLGMCEFESFRTGTLALAEQLTAGRPPASHQSIVCGEHLAHLLRRSHLDLSRIRLLSAAGTPILYHAAGRPLRAVEALRRSAAIHQKRLAVVLGLTGSEDDIAIAHFAATWFSDKAAFHCVYVEGGPGHHVYPDPCVSSEDRLAERLRAERIFARAHEALAAHGITPVSEALLSGNPSGKLLGSAQDLAADVIVIRAADAPAGMTANTPCPVIFLPDRIGLHRGAQAMR
ncbi:MAG TPA: phosphoglycerate kinase [Candidatus Acidoferrum sp.]|nr:phosphoglycerate kinase [Candidatus Acidoferrum sp.]